MAGEWRVAGLECAREGCMCAHVLCCVVLCCVCVLRSARAQTEGKEAGAGPDGFTLGSCDF